ncbi:VWA domain-containing protein [Caldiplasma sukawensis]
MTYEAEISRRNPGLFVFLLDQSRSMSHKMAGGNDSKAKEASNAINSQINELINRCTKADGIRPYFDVAVIGYGFKSGQAGGLISDHPISISEMEKHVIRTEKRKTVIDGEEIEIETPIWFEPAAAYDTPMVKALMMAEEWIDSWIKEHPDSFPPVLINISDGGASDGDPTKIAEDIMKLSTNDGNVMIWNCHLSENSSEKKIIFPVDVAEVKSADKHSEQMFNMSTVIPESMMAIAREEYSDVRNGSRAYAYNASLEDLIKLLDIGTRVAYTRVE